MARSCIIRSAIPYSYICRSNTKTMELLQLLEDYKKQMDRKIIHYGPFQIFTVPSLLAEANFVLSGDQAMACTWSEWARYVWNVLPLAAPHTLTVVSTLPEAMRVPSGAHATALT